MVVTIYFRTVHCYTAVAANYVSTLECTIGLLRPCNIGKGKGAKGATLEHQCLRYLYSPESKLNAKLIACDSKWLLDVISQQRKIHVYPR